jgi:hypothetical protein
MGRASGARLSPPERPHRDRESGSELRPRDSGALPRKRDGLITDARHIAAALAKHGELRETLTVAEAADHLNAITGPELHRVLVIDRGWTPGRYRAWTQRNLENYLLRPPS